MVTKLTLPVIEKRVQVGKLLPLPVIEVSATGYSPRTTNDVVVQVAVDLQVEYEGVTQHEILYLGDFNGIKGHPITQEVADALAVLNKHFVGLILADYGVLPS